MIHKIKCRFCGSETGEMELKDEELEEGQEPKELTNEEMGIADSRCEACEKKHGSFSDMAELAEKEIGATHEEIKTMLVRAEYKKEKFEVLVATKKSEIKIKLEKESKGPAKKEK